MRKILLVVAALALSGCASMVAQRDAQLAAFNSTVPTCADEATCKAMWEAAQVWVAKNGKTKIETVTDVMIETHASDWSTDLVIQVLKEPQGNGAYRIVFDGWCQNPFGCVPSEHESGMAFNQAVSAAAP